MLLITGHPRSGTYYTCELLRALGFAINHEYYGRDGISSWHLGALNKMNQSELVEIIARSINAHVIEGHEKKEGVASITNRFDKIIHQVRNPIKVISSSQTLSVGSWQFMNRYIKLPQTNDPVIFAMYSWVNWNCLIENLIVNSKVSSIRIRIEDIQDKYVDLYNFLEIDNLINLPIIDKKTNTREYQHLISSDMQSRAPELFNKMLKLAIKYGYRKEELEI